MTQDIIAIFIDHHRELASYKEPFNDVNVDGQSLSLVAIAAVARHGVSVHTIDHQETTERMQRSRVVIARSVEESKSVYGVSTGFGGSADTRTNNYNGLGFALLQGLHSGILSLPTSDGSALPLLDPLASTCMPEAWVRAAVLVRINSLVRGHSGVRPETVESLRQLLIKDMIPLVPMRGSISASGDLAPLSYVAGVLTGNASLYVYDGPKVHGRRAIIPSPEALNKHGLNTVTLQPKEHLAILNGTAFSASLAALCLHDAVQLATLSLVCTAMGTEALLGARGSYDRFIHDVARPHPGQVQVARTIWGLLEGSLFAQLDEVERTIQEDEGELRQDRYPLRTSPQFLGPQIEDILSAVETVTLECNSTTDNPLIDVERQKVHHGGNFQAMAVTNAMEKTRLALQNIGKLLFSQSTELCNPTMNRGLPPSLAATDPSLDYHGKGLDIAMASYVSELGYLSSPVSTHIQSAEMHNQAVNSLALISARATVNVLHVLSMLTASYIYLLCQGMTSPSLSLCNLSPNPEALDIRALQAELHDQLVHIINEELNVHFSSHLAEAQISSLADELMPKIRKSLDETSRMDSIQRMKKVASSCSDTLLDFVAAHTKASTKEALAQIIKFRDSFAVRATECLQSLRVEYLQGERGPAPASRYLNKTKPLYEFIRIRLSVRMHGIENLVGFKEGLGVQDATMGQNITRILEAIQDGRISDVMVGMLS